MASPILAGMGSRTDLTTPPLILASASVYRRALLDRLGLPFAISAPGIDETRCAANRQRTRHCVLPRRKLMP